MTRKYLIIQGAIPIYSDMVGFIRYSSTNTPTIAEISKAMADAEYKQHEEVLEVLLIIPEIRGYIESIIEED